MPGTLAARGRTRPRPPTRAGAARRSPRGRCAPRDRRALGGERAAERRAEVLGVVDALVAAAVERGGVREVEAVRRGDVLLEVVALAATGRKWKIPPPSLLSSTIVSVRPSRRRGEQAADVVGQRDVADQQHDRAVGAAAATPNAVETVPSIPLAPRLASTRGGRLARPGRTSRRRAPASRRRRRAVASAGSATPSSAATRGSLSPSRASASRSRRARGAVGARARRRATPARALARAPIGVERRARVGGDDRADAPRRVLPRGLGVERDLERVEAGEPRAQRLGGRQVADAQHEVGRVRGGEAGVAQQRVVVGDRGGPRRAPDSGSASSGMPARRRTRRARAPSRGSRSARPGDDDGARARVELGAQAVDQRRRRRRAGAAAA